MNFGSPLGQERKTRSSLPCICLQLTLRPSKSKCLFVVHAFTGCDTTSFFAGQTMKTAWKTWDNFPDVTSAFMKLTSTPSALSNESLAIIEKFVILMYDRISRLNKVSVDMTFFVIFLTHEIFLIFAFVIPLLSGQRCLEFLLTKKGRGLEGLPPTHNALKRHVKGANDHCRACASWPHRLGRDFRQRREDETTMDYPTSSSCQL